MTAQDRAAVEAAIPHRDPFLFVDRVTDRGEGWLTSEWRVPPEADWFRGHYPAQPILPGALLSEHVFQTAAVFVSEALSGFDAADGVPVLTKIESARFKRVVRPGETVTTRVELRERLGPAWYLSGKVTCGGDVALRISFVLSATQAMARLMEGGGA